MKAILVIDMPADCIKCPLADGYCWKTFPAKGKADGCPLKPLPEKKDVPPDYGMMYGNPFGEGWNACIKELEK